MTKILVNLTKPGIDEIYGILRSAVIPDFVQETSSSLSFSRTQGSSVTNELYFIRDYLGNIKSIFDENGNMLYYRLYDEFGGESGQSRSQDYTDQNDLTQPCFTPFGFTSREFDEIADLYFYRSRYYDPTLGRFTQRDKFNEAGYITGNPAVIYNPLQLNDYTYVGNNPLNYIDPYGEFISPFLGILVFEIVKITYYIPRINQINSDVWNEHNIRYPSHSFNRHKTIPDAWRHAEASSRISNRINKRTAFILGVGHEIVNMMEMLRKENKIDWNDIYMDLYNNKMGRTGLSADELISLNLLRTLNPNNLGECEYYR
jgi:RHS repeat-associated protein